MSNKQKRFILPEEEIPHYWYNIQADMVNKPMPPLHPGTKQPLKAEDLYPIFAEELCRQELNQTDAWIEIPDEVRDMYKYYRSTPLVRAFGLEQALGTPAHIYFKNESVSPMGSQSWGYVVSPPMDAQCISPIPYLVDRFCSSMPSVRWRIRPNSPRVAISVLMFSTISILFSLLTLCLSVPA